MADSIIQLPYTATTSGDTLDASLLGSVKRERMVLGNDASTAVAVVTTSGALTVTGSTSISLSSAPTVNISSGIITLSSNPTVTIGASLVNLAVAPVDAISAAFQPITTSGGGLVTVSSQSYLVGSLSSGTVTLSSAIGVSSGLITLTGTNVVTNASSGFVQVYQSTSPWSIAGTVVSASSGLVQVLQSTGVWAVSGTVTVGNPSTAPNLTGSTGTLAVVTSAGSQFVSIVSSGGIMAPVTSSAGVLVNASITGGAGSTAVTIQGAAGVNAPVTSSWGLQVTNRSTYRQFGIVNTTLGAPLTQVLTTLPLMLYSMTITTTVAGTAGNAVSIYSVGTSALSTMAPTLRLTNPAAAGTMTQLRFDGVYMSAGIQIAVSLSFQSTNTNTANALIYNIEYEL